MGAINWRVDERMLTENERQVLQEVANDTLRKEARKTKGKGDILNT